MTTLRLTKQKTQQSFVVDVGERTVFAAHDGTVTRGDEIRGPLAQEAFRAATTLKDLFEDPYPGATTPDGKFRSNGLVSMKDVRRIEQGKPVAVRPPWISEHLYIGDTNHDGALGFKENVELWRKTGKSAVGASLMALTSTAVFGLRYGNLAIDIDRLPAPKGGSGLVKNGKVDRKALDGYLAEFDARGQNGALTTKQVSELIAEKKGELGRISARQYKSLFALTKKMHKRDIVTKRDFEEFFVNPSRFLYRANDVISTRTHK